MTLEPYTPTSAINFLRSNPLATVKDAIDFAYGRWPKAPREVSAFMRDWLELYDRMREEQFESSSESI
jgi:hypothetical protein